MTYHPIATTLLAMATLSAPAHSQHAVTMTASGDTFTVRTDGPVPVAVVELFSGSGARFAAGTDGDLGWPDAGGYRVTTLTGDGSFHVITSGGWAGSRATVIWADGFYAIVSAPFTYSDIPPVPEPATAALMMVGLALVTTRRNIIGALKNV
jgi:hypothetical protein